MNADHERMRRIFVHELCHLFVRESTGGEVIQGDGLSDLAVRPWLDEGLAEVLSWRGVGARRTFVVNQRDGAEAWPVAELDKHLAALSSNLRGAAVDVATRRVAALIGKVSSPHLEAWSACQRTRTARQKFRARTDSITLL